MVDVAALDVTAAKASGGEDMGVGTAGVEAEAAPSDEIAI
jgi:hypothetical protein